MPRILVDDRMEPIQELEQRVKARGVRAEERLALLRLLKADSASLELAERDRRLREAVTAALRKLRGELAG